MSENVSWISWSRRELLMVVLVVVGLAWGLKYNFDLSAAKARDWERKEQTKRVIRILGEEFAGFYASFPPHTDNWEIRGCGDQTCSVTDNQGTACLWGSDRPALTFACEQYSYFSLSPLPDNPLTAEGDRIKYRRLNSRSAIGEVCLELKSDPEAMKLEESLIGWEERECPSGRILIWPEKRTLGL